MKNILRNIPAFLLVILIVCSFAGCGEKEDGNTVLVTDSTGENVQAPVDNKNNEVEAEGKFSGAFPIPSDVITLLEIDFEDKDEHLVLGYRVYMQRPALYVNIVSSEKYITRSTWLMEYIDYETEEEFNSIFNELDSEPRGELASGIMEENNITYLQDRFTVNLKDGTAISMNYEENTGGNGGIGPFDNSSDLTRYELTFVIRDEMGDDIIKAEDIKSIIVDGVEYPVDIAD